MKLSRCTLCDSIAIAAALLIPTRFADAQNAPPATVDVIDIWNQIRHKAPAPNADDYTTPMKALAPVIGVKPSAGVMFGVAGNITFFAGDPTTTHMLNKRSRTNLCFDIGFGKDGSRGVYLAVQEAF
jgi:hypothetical protein